MNRVVVTGYSGLREVIPDRYDPVAVDDGGVVCIGLPGTSPTDPSSGYRRDPSADLPTTDPTIVVKGSLPQAFLEVADKQAERLRRG